MVVAAGLAFDDDHSLRIERPVGRRKAACVRLRRILRRADEYRLAHECPATLDHVRFGVSAAADDGKAGVLRVGQRAVGDQEPPRAAQPHRAEVGLRAHVERRREVVDDRHRALVQVAAVARRRQPAMFLGLVAQRRIADAGDLRVIVVGFLVRLVGARVRHIPDDPVRRVTYRWIGLVARPRKIERIANRRNDGLSNPPDPWHAAALPTVLSEFIAAVHELP